MSDVFFRELGIPAPDFNLEVGSGSHAQQTARIMERFEPVLLSAFLRSEAGGQRSGAKDWRLEIGVRGAENGELKIKDRPTAKPDWVIVVGDVNSTLACTVVAAKLGVKVAHVEAGLRSFDRSMPEEINRIVTDALADLLLPPSEDANENLRREGVPASRIKLVGNIMIDALLQNLPQARASRVLETLKVGSGAFAYVTLHRPNNVDCLESLSPIIAELKNLSERIPVVFPIHPRTRRMMADFGISLEGCVGLKAVEPVGYHDSLCLTENARLVLTDSGGLQEESTYFRTPCLTLRPNTERPITVTLGSNRLTTVDRLRADFTTMLERRERSGQTPPMWDGQTAVRILNFLLNQ